MGFDASQPPGAGVDASMPIVAQPEAGAVSPQDATVVVEAAADAAPVAEDGAAPITMEAGAADAAADSSGQGAGRAALVLPDSWTRLDVGTDPFTDRPVTVDCRPDGVAAELLADERVLGVDTGFCSYLTAQQATRRAVAAGEVIKVRLWHFELSAPEPAEAHAVILVDGLSVLDEHIPIPSPGGLIVRQLRVERDVPVGAPVYFHLHNHGANSWALVEVSSGPG